MHPIGDQYTDAMRLLTWNCQGGFQNKSHLVALEAPDVAVIQECSRRSLDKLPQGYSGLWLGGPETKGIGLMYRAHVGVSVADQPHEHWIIPVDCNVNGMGLRLLAVWTIRQPKGSSYVDQVMSCMKVHPEWFSENAMIAGDFNSNLNFDKASKPEHKTMIGALQQLDFESIYHSAFAEKHGSESQKTFFHGRKQDRPFHIDYIFVPSQLVAYVTSVTVGAQRFWRQYSDHCPISINLAPTQ